MRGKVARELRQMVRNLFPDRPDIVSTMNKIAGTDKTYRALAPSCKRSIYKQVKLNYKRANSEGTY